jgi:hypothetical protein
MENLLATAQREGVGHAVILSIVGADRVVVDPAAGMFGAVPGDVLIAPEGAVLAKTRYRDWLTR